MNRICFVYERAALLLNALLFKLKFVPILKTATETRVVLLEKEASFKALKVLA